MLNIVEPVPPTEPIPYNSRNSVYHFQYNSGILGISSYQFLGIPGIPSDSGIGRNSVQFRGIPTDSGFTQFRIEMGSSLDG
jgi:hypothetical protein